MTRARVPASLRVADKLGFRPDRSTIDAAGELIWLATDGRQRGLCAQVGHVVRCVSS